MSHLCRNDEWLAAYLDKELSEDECRLYEMHLSHCQSCLAEFIAARTELDEMTAEETAPTVAAGHTDVKSHRESPRSGALDLGRALTRRVLGSAALESALSFAFACALVGGLFVLMLSTDWDPDYIAGKSDLAKIVAVTDIGAMRLSGVPQSPIPRTAHFRGIGDAPDALVARAGLELRNAAAGHSDDWRPRALLGNLYLAQGRFELAKTSYDRAIRLNAEEAMILNNRAVMAFREGDFAASRLCLEQALSCEKTTTESLYNLAVLCRALGERDSMKRYIEWYLARDPSSPWADRARELADD
jgi:tetratricopeptide (TPR) repeat protein